MFDNGAVSAGVVESGVTGIYRADGLGATPVPGIVFASR